MQPEAEKGAVAKSKRLFKPRGLRSSHRQRDATAQVPKTFRHIGPSGADAVPQKQNGLSLNLATRRALVDGAASRHRGSPRGQGRYPETGERTRPERERHFMCSTPPSPGLRPERDFVSIVELAVSKRAQRQHSQGSQNR